MIEIQSIQDIAGIKQLSLSDRKETRTTIRPLNKQEITHILKCCDALWLHSRDPKDPHVELTSGKHSDGFIDILRALRFTNVCELLAWSLVGLIKHRHPELKFDWGIGSDHAGAAFSHSVATHLGIQHDFTEKGPDKTQLWKRFTIQPKEVVLQIEELMTTAGTLRAVRDGIVKGNNGPVTFAPIAVVLIHRSDIFEVDGTMIDYPVHYDINTWEPQDCPLCVAGSKPISNCKANWAELTGKS